MPSPLPRRAFLALALKTPVLALACAEATYPETTATPTEAAPTLSPVPPTPTEVPATPTPPRPLLELMPAQIVQGGFATIVLNQPAASATASFQGRQYPMLRAGDRMWTVVGVGAFATPQAYAVAVSYTPLGGAPATASGSLVVLDKDYPVENIVLDPQTSALLAPDIVNAELAQRASIYGAFTASRLWRGPFARPNVGPISSIYGEARSYNGGPVTSYHTGTDFAGDVGSPISAAAAGTVAFAGELKVRGGSVILDHGAGIFTAYHHLSRIDVAGGQPVAKGQLLGGMGATGLVTASHLHWEVLVRGIEVDGQLWLTGEEFGL